MKKVFCWFFHFTAYYVTWFVCILYAAVDQPWHGPLIGVLIIISQISVQIVTKSPWCKELIFALILMSVAILIDSIFMHTGWITFKANPFYNVMSPPWMSCLWLSFGFTITVTNRAWLHRYVLLGILTFISLPFAYWLGAVTGAADVKSMWLYPLLGGIWMILLPLLIGMFLHISKGNLANDISMG